MITIHAYCPYEDEAYEYELSPDTVCLNISYSIGRYQTEFVDKRFTLFPEKANDGNYVFALRENIGLREDIYSQDAYYTSEPFNFTKMMKSKISKSTKQEIIRGQICTAFLEAMEKLTHFDKDFLINYEMAEESLIKYHLEYISIFSECLYKWFKEQIKEGDKKK